MRTATKSGTGVSHYLRLYRVLSQALAEGRIGTGQLLPSEPALMRDYGISRSTVRRALARLEAEGRIERRRGSGTFAREHAGQHTDFSAILDRTTDPAAVTSRMLASRRVPTPAFLSEAQPGFGATLQLIRRTRHIAGTPMALESAYLPEEIAGALTGGWHGTDGAGILEVLAALGHESSSLEREFAALEADPLAADSLGLAIGEPIFSVRTLARDRRHAILAYVDCLYRPDRYQAHAAIEIGTPRRRRHRMDRRN